MKVPTTSGPGQGSGWVTTGASCDPGGARATLAEAFLLAMMGNPIAARERLDFLKTVVGAATLKGSSLEADYVLVDAHVRVHEDRALEEADSTRRKVPRATPSCRSWFWPRCRWAW